METKLSYLWIFIIINFIRNTDAQVNSQYYFPSQHHTQNGFVPQTSLQFQQQNPSSFNNFFPSVGNSFSQTGQNNFNSPGSFQEQLFLRPTDRNNYRFQQFPFIQGSSLFDFSPRPFGNPPVQFQNKPSAAPLPTLIQILKNPFTRTQTVRPNGSSGIILPKSPVQEFENRTRNVHRQQAYLEDLNELKKIQSDGKNSQGTSNMHKIRPTIPVYRGTRPTWTTSTEILDTDSIDPYDIFQSQEHFPFKFTKRRPETSTDSNRNFATTSTEYFIEDLNIKNKTFRNQNKNLSEKISIQNKTVQLNVPTTKKPVLLETTTPSSVAITNLSSTFKNTEEKNITLNDSQLFNQETTAITPLINLTTQTPIEDNKPVIITSNFFLPGDDYKELDSYDGQSSQETKSEQSNITYYDYDYEYENAGKSNEMKNQSTNGPEILILREKNSSESINSSMKGKDDDNIQSKEKMTYNNSSSDKMLNETTISNEESESDDFSDYLDEDAGYVKLKDDIEEKEVPELTTKSFADSSILGPQIDNILSKNSSLDKDSKRDSRIILETKQVAEKQQINNVTQNFVVIASVQTSKSINNGARFLSFPDIEQREEKQLLSDLEQKIHSSKKFKTAKKMFVPTEHSTELSTESILDKLDDIQSELTDKFLVGNLSLLNMNDNIANYTFGSSRKFQPNIKKFLPPTKPASAIKLDIMSKDNASDASFVPEATVQPNKLLEILKQIKYRENIEKFLPENFEEKSVSKTISAGISIAPKLNTTEIHIQRKNNDTSLLSFITKPLIEININSKLLENESIKNSTNKISLIQSNESQVTEENNSTKPNSNKASNDFRFVFPKSMNKKTKVMTPRVYNMTNLSINETKKKPLVRSTTEFPGWPTPSTTTISNEKLSKAISFDIPNLVLSTTSTTQTSLKISPAPITTTSVAPNPTQPGHCKNVCDLAATLRIVEGIKWSPELLDHYTLEWNHLARELELQLNEIYSTADTLKDWFKKIRIDSFNEGSVLVDYFIELSNITRTINTLDIKEMFHSALNKSSKTDPIQNAGSEIIGNNYILGKFVLDPSSTDFIVIHRQTFAKMDFVDEPPLIPQWGIVLIVIGIGSFCFIILFGIAVLISRRRTSHKTPTTLTADMLNELNKNHMGGVDNYGVDDFYNGNDAWSDAGQPIKSKVKRYTNTLNHAPSQKAYMYDSWSSTRHRDFYYDPNDFSNQNHLDVYSQHYDHHDPYTSSDPEESIQEQNSHRTKIRYDKDYYEEPVDF